MKQARRFILSFLALLTCTIMYAQEEITGTVNDAMGPVIGATVMEKGTNNGTVTDFDGNFKLKVAPGKTLVFTYIGYQTVELPAANGMQVTMQDDAQTLSEVVVTGYQVQRKADLTGSVGVVETKDFKSSNTDPMTSLQGKVPGMTITSSGSPSGEANVQIRGIGSMGGSSTAPLYIVDGMPYSGSLNSLNSSDIESMQVLKDAASASIYGSRAANGVVVITTKKGKKGDRINIDFNASVSVAWMTQKMKLLNGQQYATALVQAALNDGKNPYEYADNYGLALQNLETKGGTPITVYNPATGTMEQFGVTGYNDGYMNPDKTMLYSNTDWVDEISRTGITQNYDLAFTLPDAVYDKKILVLVAMSKAEVMETVSLSNSMYSEVHPIGMINKGHDVSMPVMQMAKRLNYFYSCSFSGKGVPTSMPKDEIEEKWAQQTSVALRFSNIYNSMTLPTKMRSLGHDENDWDKFYALTKDEIRQTAAVEHNRWSVERLILGFRPPTDSERAEIEENIEQLAAARRRGEKSELNDFKNMYKKRKIHYDLCSYAELGIDKTGQDVRIYDYDLTACIPLIANSYHEDGQEHA